MRCRANEEERKKEREGGKEKECTEVVEIVSGTLVLCSTLKSAPKTRQKDWVASRVPGGGVCLACYVFVFFPFFVFVFHAHDSALPFLRLVHRRWGEEVAAVWHTLPTTTASTSRCDRHWRHRVLWLDESFLAALDWDAHVASVPPLAAVTFVLADAALNADTGVLAATARSLAVATLLTFAAALATRLRREIFLVSTKRMLEVDGGGSRSLTRL
jgi:proteasome lid subunit RPN8/RPN11